MRPASFAFYYVCEKVFDECKAKGAKSGYKLHLLPTYLICRYHVQVDIITTYIPLNAPFQHIPLAAEEISIWRGCVTILSLVPKYVCKQNTIWMFNI